MNEVRGVGNLEQFAISKRLNEELIRNKAPIEPPSKNLRFSFQVIAFSEIDDAPHKLSSLPNLVTALMGVVSACRRFAASGNYGVAEVLININNKAGNVPLGNKRSLNLFSLIDSNDPLPLKSELPELLDWLPSYSEALQDNKKMMLIDSHFRLLQQIRTLQERGYQFHAVDCTDGTTLRDAKNAAQQTCGARRLLLTEIARRRFQDTSEDKAKSVCIPLDGDVIVSPNILLEYANMIDVAESPRPLVVRSSVKMIDRTVELLHDLQIDGINSATLHSFTDQQLETLSTLVYKTEQFLDISIDQDLSRVAISEERDAIFNQLDVYTLLLLKGFTASQIKFLQSMDTVFIAKFYPRISKIDNSSRLLLSKKINIIKVLRGSSEYSTAMTLYFLIKRVVEAFSGFNEENSRWAKADPLIGSYGFNILAYERIMSEIDIAKCEDKDMLALFYSEAEALQSGKKLVTIHDRIRPSSDFGNFSNRYSTRNNSQVLIDVGPRLVTWFRTSGFPTISDILEMKLTENGSISVPESLIFALTKYFDLQSERFTDSLRLDWEECKRRFAISQKDPELQLHHLVDFVVKFSKKFKTNN